MYLPPCLQIKLRYTSHTLCVFCVVLQVVPCIGSLRGAALSYRKPAYTEKFCDCYRPQKNDKRDTLCNEQPTFSKILFENWYF
jgi:hypothetical protein